MKKETSKKPNKKGSTALIIIGVIASVLIVGGLSPAESEDEEAEKDAVEMVNEIKEAKSAEQKESEIAEEGDVEVSADQDFIPTIVDNEDVDRSISDQQEMVLITQTGTKYHLRECTDGSYYEVTLEDAISLGLEPCKRCYGG